jgi:uncharacterized protein YgbK (DUF1537 family)
MMRLAIIADDLTGALDASAPFADRGLRTAVTLGNDGISQALASGAEIIGVSTDSREVAPDQARDAVKACLASLPHGVAIFKKVDSRLKGNISAELDAIPFTRGLAIPAIPDFGRWTKNGLLGGFGVDRPINIAERLGHHATKIVAPDAAGEADIVQALVCAEHDLPIGARGLAEALAGQMAPTPAPKARVDIGRPAICVIGSTDPITRAQVQYLRAAYPRVDYRPAPNGRLSSAQPFRAPLTVLQAIADDDPVDPATVAMRLADAVRDQLPSTVATLLISGGATAQTVLRALGIQVLDLQGEALPGIPVARAGRFTIITKSGGFGQPNALAKVLGHLAGTMRESNA